LSSVTILSKQDGRRWVSDCNRWLADDADDKKIERSLDAIEKPINGILFSKQSLIDIILTKLLVDCRGVE